MATASSCPNSHPLAWDRLQNLGSFNADLSLVMDDYDDGSYSTPFFSTCSSSPLSTGYLEDVLVEFGSKRRRLMFCNDDHQEYQYDWTNDSIMESYSNSSCAWGLSDTFNTQFSSFNNGASSDELWSTSTGSEEGNVMTEVKTPEEAISGFGDDHNALGRQDSSSCEGSARGNKSGRGGEGAEDDVDDINKTKTRVVYPFALVKPGGVEGDVTLNDINRRILMRPTRPVRHPVGDFACRPRLLPEGPGISGKAVVALTRIQTHGKGTITIVRTKG